MLPARARALLNAGWPDALLLLGWETVVGRLAEQVPAWPVTSLLVTTLGHVLVVGWAVGGDLAGRETALHHLGALAGLVVVLAPGIALLWPMMVVGSAPDHTFPDWLWGLPLPALFGTLAIIGIRAGMPDDPPSPWAARAERMGAVAWLIGCEAVIAASMADTPPEARIGAVAVAAVAWLPSRLAVITADQGGRAELAAAILGSVWILASLAVGAGP